MRKKQRKNGDYHEKGCSGKHAKRLRGKTNCALVQKANQFSSQIYMESGDNKRVNVKSIMGMMSMALLNGEEVVIDAEGEDEEAATAAIEEFLTK